MDNFFEKFDFGKKIKPYLEKTRLQYKDESIYKVVEKIKDFKLKKGDRLYLDGFHADHLEVFNDRGMFKFVLNFDGSINEAKTISGMGRRIPL